MHRSDQREMLVNQFGVIPGAWQWLRWDHFTSGDDELGLWSSE